MFKKRILFFLLVCVVPVAVPFFGCGKKSDLEDPLEERLRQERLEAEKKAAELRASKPKTTTKPAISVCDRTEEIKNAIMRKLVKYESRYTHFSQCDLAIVEDLKTITSLKIFFGFQKTIEIKREDFSDLASLHSLELSHLNTKALPPDLFSHLTSLRVLRLEYIRFGTEEAIVSLPAGIFSHLTSLRYISIQHMNLSTLPAGIFSGLTSLTYLSLSDNNLNSLPAGIFSGLTSLRDLSLWNNKLGLEDFPVGAFSNIGSESVVVRLNRNLFTREELLTLSSRVRRNTQDRVIISLIGWPGQEKQP